MVNKLNNKISFFCEKNLNKGLKNTLEILAKKRDIEHISVLPDIYQKEHTNSPSGLTVVTKNLLLPKLLYGVGCGISLFKIDLGKDIPKENITKIMDIICSSIKNKELIKESIKSIKTINPILEFDQFLNDIDIKGISELWRNDTVSNMRFNLLRKDIFDEYVKWPQQDMGSVIIEGNHFIELQRIDEVYDECYLKTMGLSKTDYLLMIHLEDEGLNTQLETSFRKKHKSKKIRYPSKEAEEFITLTNISQRYCFLNRIILAKYIFNSLKNNGIKVNDINFILDTTHTGIFRKKTEEGVEIYHTSGTTLALPPGNENLSGIMREKGHPLILPGALGIESYILKTSFGTLKSSLSVNHGLGRKISKKYARTNFKEKEVVNTFKYPNIIIKKVSDWDLVSQMNICYKDINNVLRIMQNNNLALKVAKLQPLGTLKG